MAESDLGRVKGVDGVSPSIEPNAENTDSVYKLDIKPADGVFTTPNLKGEDAQTGGLVFGQDAEGNWGYMPPGADAVVPFKKGGGSGGGGMFSGFTVLGLNSVVFQKEFSYADIVTGVITQVESPPIIILS